MAATVSRVPAAGDARASAASRDDDAERPAEVPAGDEDRDAEAESDDDSICTIELRGGPGGIATADGDPARLGTLDLGGGRWLQANPRIGLVERSRETIGGCRYRVFGSPEGAPGGVYTVRAVILPASSVLQHRLVRRRVDLPPGSWSLAPEASGDRTEDGEGR